MKYCSLQHQILLSSPDTSTTEHHFHFGPAASFFLEILIIALCSSPVWRRQWQPTPVLLPRKSHGQRSPVGYSPWSRKESDMTCLLNENSREASTFTDTLKITIAIKYMRFYLRTNKVFSLLTNSSAGKNNSY